MLKGKVLPHCIKKPANYAQQLPFVNGGNIYPVTRGETFLKIGETTNTAVVDLLKHNFGTTNPNEINYYLEHNLKCGYTTQNRKNYVFSGEESLYIPGSSILPDDDENFIVLLGLMGFGPNFYDRHIGAIKLAVGTVEVAAKVLALGGGALAGGIAVPIVLAVNFGMMVYAAGQAHGVGGQIMAVHAQVYGVVSYIYGERPPQFPRTWEYIHQLKYKKSMPDRKREWRAGVQNGISQIRNYQKQRYQAHLKQTKSNGKVPWSEAEFAIKFKELFQLKNIAEGQHLPIDPAARTKKEKERAMILAAIYKSMKPKLSLIVKENVQTQYLQIDADTYPTGN